MTDCDVVTSGANCVISTNYTRNKIVYIISSPRFGERAHTLTVWTRWAYTQLGAYSSKTNYSIEITNSIFHPRTINILIGSSVRVTCVCVCDDQTLE